MKTTYRLVDFALKRMPTDGSGYGAAVAYAWGAKDDEPIFDRASLYVERLPLPLLWQHDPGTDDIDNIIGRVTAERTTDEGWEIDFKLDLSNPLAMKVYERMLNANDAQFSVGFAYDKKDLYQGGDGLVHLRRSEVIEVSVVTVGANRGTRLVSLKTSAGARRTSIRAEATADFLARMKATYPAAAAELHAEARRDVERAKAAERRADAAKALDARSLALLGTKPTPVVVGLDMRPLDPDEREQERRAREDAERQHRDREREREHAAIVAARKSRSRAAARGISRGEDGVTYAP